MSKKKTTKQFIEEARLVHGNKYDYSKSEYVNATTKVIIICPQHGEFLQRPCDHLNGRGCKTCFYEENGKQSRLDFESFLEKAKSIHGTGTLTIKIHIKVLILMWKLLALYMVFLYRMVLII